MKIVLVQENVLDRVPKMTETELRRFFLATCTATFPDVRLFIRNVGEFQDEAGNIFRAGIKGQADLYGHLFPPEPHLPVALEIEAKNVRTKVTPEQEFWAAYCRTGRIPYLQLRARKDETPKAIILRWAEETDVWLEEIREKIRRIA